MSVRNIIIVNDFAYINGGAGKVAIKSAIGLSKLGYSVVLFTAVGTIDESLKKTGVKVICLGQKDILSDSNRLRAVYQGIWNKYAKNELSETLIGLSPNETIVHFHAWIKALSPAVFEPIAKLGFRIVITLHDYFLFCPNGGLFNYQSLKICDKKANTTQCFLCNCDSRSYPQKIWRDIRQLVQWHWFRQCKNVSFIYISKLNKQVSYPYLKNISENWYFLQNPIELNEKRPVDISQNSYYLFVARLSAEKGIKMFCDAITELGLRGCVLGDGYMRDRLERQYPNIEFVGWVAGYKKEQIIRKGKALIFPSLWYEGAPLTIVEMKSYGIPCIVPDRCAAAEEIIDGKTGFIFKTGNIKSLKDTILKLENSDKSILQENIINEFIPERYLVQTHLKNLVSIYSTVLKRG